MATTRTSFAELIEPTLREMFQAAYDNKDPDMLSNISQMLRVVNARSISKEKHSKDDLDKVVNDVIKRM